MQKKEKMMQFFGDDLDARLCMIEDMIERVANHEPLLQLLNKK